MKTFYFTHWIRFFKISFCQQMKGEEDATEESHKQAVRKRRVRKDWGGEARAYCLLSPPMRRRWKGRLCCCSPSEWSSTSLVSSKPVGSLQSPRCFTHPSTADHCKEAHCFLLVHSLNSDESPVEFEHLLFLLCLVLLLFPSPFFSWVFAVKIPISQKAT